MATASSLITTIHSILTDIDNDNELLELKIGLKNLKTLLLCSIPMGVNEPFLFSQIKYAVGRIPVVGREVEGKVHGLAKQLADAWYTRRDATAGEVVQIADSVLESTADFLALAGNCAVLISGFRPLEGEVIDAFVVRMKFLRNFILCFATSTGAELQNVLIQIRPIAMSAQRVFVKDTPDGDWFQQVQSKCSTLNAMAVDLRLNHACAGALMFLRISSNQVMGKMILRNLLDSLISLLWDVLRHSNSKIPQLVALYRRLRLCRGILKKYPYDRHNGLIGFLIFDAGIFICSLHQTGVEADLGGLSDLLQRFDDFQGADVQNSLPQAIPQAKTAPHTAAATGSSQRPQGSRQLFHFEDDEISSNLDGLMRGSKQRRILQISGMAGIGKTTLASQLYNHRSVNYHFHARAWCTVSQVLDKKKVLRQLLTQIGVGNGSCTLYMSEDDLANKLRQSLRGKRYLIVLDDVWTDEVWNRLEASFPDDSNQSRIILTSRNVHIVPDDLLVNGRPFMLRLRTDHECLRILGQMLFPDSNWDQELLEFGMLTARKCKGLPLMVAVVAGILATQATQVWREIMQALSFSDVSHEEQCRAALELSYKHLPIELQACFIYLGLFPEGQEISVTRLIQLWVGEGFFGDDHVAREYLEKLIDRSLVMVVQNRSIGGARICKIHDLVHDFCRAKAMQHSYFHLLLQRHDQLFEFNEPSNLQRLCIHSDPLHFKESRLFCPLARSILFFSAPESSHESCLFDLSFIIQIYQRVQVIEMEQIPMSSGLPSDIWVLGNLKYLSIQIIGCKIPASIGNLSNLETFIGDFWSDDAIWFPLTLRNLHKLKNLYIRNSRRGGHGFRFKPSNLGDGFGPFLLAEVNFFSYLPSLRNLPNLKTLSGVVFQSNSSFLEKEMTDVTNLKIRRLKCCILPGVSLHAGVLLRGLESLTIQGNGKPELQIASFGSLRKLTLNGFNMSREEVAVIGKFPVLEVLKLLNTTFSVGALEIEEGEFSRLRILHLEDSGNSLQRWRASDDSLSCLAKLKFSKCGSLEEIPSSLEYSSTIEEIQVYGCSPTLESLVRSIEDVQRDFGNFVKVDVRF